MPTAADRDEAMDLLVSILTPEERDAFEANNCQAIEVVGSEGGRFVIDLTGTQGNIRKLDEHGCQVGAACIAPAARLRGNRWTGEVYQPVGYGDSWLGQYLTIKHQERMVDEVGIWSRYRCRREPQPVQAPGSPRQCPCGCGLVLDEATYFIMAPPLAAFDFIMNQEDGVVTMSLTTDRRER